MNEDRRSSLWRTIPPTFGGKRNICVDAAREDVFPDGWNLLHTDSGLEIQTLGKLKLT